MLKLCSCGAEPEIVKLFESKRYDCFVRCPRCGKEGKAYTSKQNAIKAWNRDSEILTSVILGTEKL